MLKTSVRLWKLTSCNLFGLNEFRHTKDAGKKKRAIGIGCFWGLAFLVLEGYLIASMFGYVFIGMAEILPIYCYFLTTFLILLLNVLKAGNIIFTWNNLENLLALPIQKRSILLSRFWSLYTVNLLLATAVLLPGMLFYGVAMKAGIVSYLCFLLGIFLTPLVPLVVSVLLSALVKGISARMRHKSLAEAFLMIVFTVGILVLSSGGDYENINTQAIKDLTETVVNMLGAMYPPAAWFQSSVTKGTLLPMLFLALLSLGVFAQMILVLDRCFLTICGALRQTGRRAERKAVIGKRTDPLWALVKREFRYYFSQSIYMTNTGIGLVMMVGCSIAFCVVGPETLEAELPVKGILVKVFPYLLAMCGCMMSPTSSAISLEGKTRWLTKSLPIPEKLQYDSKILMTLLLDVPFYVLSVLIAVIGLDMTGADLIRLVLIPGVFLVFAAVWGLYANLLFPRFDWDNEVQIVKQSVACALAMFPTMIIIFACGGAFAAAQLLSPTSIPGNLVGAVGISVVVVLTALLYAKILRKKLEQ